MSTTEMKNRSYSKHRIPEVKSTLIDRAVNYFSPERGVRRRYARTILAMTGGYSGGSKTRRGLKEWNPTGGSADTDINWDLPTLRDRSRDLTRNNPLAGGAIHTAVNNVVGPGLRLNSRIDFKALGMSKEQAKEFEERAERGFKLWADQADLEAQLSFYELQDLVFRSTLESGDVFVLMPFVQRAGDAFGLKLQVIEADRVSNPHSRMDTDRLSGGVEIDANGRPLYYHIMTSHPGDIGKGVKREWKPYRAFTSAGRKDMLHLFRKLRPGQHRGVPYLTPVIEKLKQLDRYSEAELMAAVIAGMFTVFVKTETGDGLAAMEPTADTGATSTDDEVKLDYGAIVDLNNNESIETADPNRPNQAYEKFVMAIMRETAVGLELPAEVLLKQFTNSYSAARAALLDSWTFYKCRRTWLNRKFCGPVYEAWMTEAVARGYLYAPGFTKDPLTRAAYLNAEWFGPTQGQIDPVKDVKAAEGRIGLRLTSRTEECIALTGSDWEPKVSQMEYEEELLKGLPSAGPSTSSGSDSGSGPSTGSGTGGSAEDDPDSEDDPNSEDDPDSEDKAEKRDGEEAEE